MNPELEEAKKELRDAILSYIRAVFKQTGSQEISVLMLGKDLQEVCESFSEDDFVMIAGKEGAE